MRRALALVVALVATLLVLVVAPLPAHAAGPDTFVFSGAGFGHGVGMSQYGALGQAKERRSAAQILTPYYTGTAVQAVDDNKAIRVTLAHAAPSASVLVRGEAIAGGGGGITIKVAGSPDIGGAPNEGFVFSIGIDGVSTVVSRTTGPALAAG